jgi:hypothetical protein
LPYELDLQTAETESLTYKLQSNRFAQQVCFGNQCMADMTAGHPTKQQEM